MEEEGMDINSRLQLNGGNMGGPKAAFIMQGN